MPQPAQTLRRGLPERVRSWLVCGPLGHLWSALADLALYGARSAIRRARLR